MTPNLNSMYSHGYNLRQQKTSSLVSSEHKTEKQINLSTDPQSSSCMPSFPACSTQHPSTPQLPPCNKHPPNASSSSTNNTQINHIFYHTQPPLQFSTDNISIWFTKFEAKFHNNQFSDEQLYYELINCMHTHQLQSIYSLLPLVPSY